MVERRGVDGGVRKGSDTPELWNGERDVWFAEFAGARAALERCTGSPNPTMEFGLMIGHKRARKGGAAHQPRGMGDDAAVQHRHLLGGATVH